MSGNWPSNVVVPSYQISSFNINASNIIGTLSMSQMPIPLSTLNFNGSYNNLTEKPLLFNGNFNSLMGLPTNLQQIITSPFNGNYSSLNGLPTLFSGNYDDLISKPNLFDGDY